MDAFARLGGTTPLRAAPPGILEASAATLPEPLRRFRSPHAASAAAAPPPEIAYPPKNVRVDLGIRAGDPMPLALKVRNGAPPFTWFVDGAPIAHRRVRQRIWEPRGPGFVDLMVIDGHGQRRRARFIWSR